MASGGENIGRRFQALLQQMETLLEIPAPRVEWCPAELPNSPSNIFGNPIDSRVYCVVGLFDTGHHVVQDCPKVLGRKLNLSEPLPCQIIFEAPTLLI
ncbi:MAG TPA: hypothetical protein VLZ74_09290 [Methylocella sp.]|nr:hypothetical protein [Methylocella sp.]